MRLSRFVCVVAGITVALIAPFLHAQSISAGGAAISTQTKLPYTATWTETSTRTLADGTTITRQTTTKFARDASGRTYTEMHNQLPIGSDGQPNEVVFYSVSDPVAHTHLSWNSNTKEATLSAMQSIHLSRLPDHVQAAKPDPNFQREDLGTKNIAGVNAKGIRITRIIPTGQIGNDRPITVVSETWRSTEYGLILMSTRDDPRMGKSSREVTDFEPGDPDAALFQAPQGYNVREVTPHIAAAASVQ